MPISAYLNPGLLDHIGKMELVFTQRPATATNVSIKFFERDSWTLDGKHFITEGGSGDFLGQIDGFIKNTKFQSTGGNFPFPNKPVTLFTVRIEGEDIQIPLPNSAHEKDLGFWEIAFEITATVNGQKEEFKSPVPVFMRSTPTPRAEVAFISVRFNDFPDDPTTTQLEPLATQFWNNLSDNEHVQVKGLRDVIVTIGDNDERTLRSRNNLPWGRINIISHGNDSTWFIRENSSDKDTRGWNASELKSLQVTPPSIKDVDDKTLIIVLACLVGNDLGILNAIRDLFGGRATVFAPRHTLQYKREKGVLRERLFQTWEFFVPGIADSFKAAQLVPFLKKDFGTTFLYKDFSESDWLAVANITAKDTNSDAFRDLIHEVLPDPKDPQPEFVSELAESQVKDVTKKGKPVKSQAELTALMRTLLPKSANTPASESSVEDSSDFDTYAWTWTVSSVPKTNPPEFKISGHGVRTLFSIYRLLTETENGKQVPATPNINNPVHFGRSSS